MDRPRLVDRSPGVRLFVKTGTYLDEEQAEQQPHERAVGLLRRQERRNKARNPNHEVDRSEHLGEALDQRHHVPPWVCLFIIYTYVPHCQIHQQQRIGLAFYAEIVPERRLLSAGLEEPRLPNPGSFPVPLAIREFEKNSSRILGE